MEKKSVFFCSKKPCSYEIFSADQVPLRKPLRMVHTHECCKCLEYFGEITMENVSYTLFLQLLGSISRSHRAAEQFGAGAVPLQLPVSHRAHRAEHLCCLMSPPMNGSSWGWCGWEMSWVLAVCSSQSRALKWGEGCGDGMEMGPQGAAAPMGSWHSAGTSGAASATTET